MPSKKNAPKPSAAVSAEYQRRAQKANETKARNKATREAASAASPTPAQNSETIRMSLAANTGSYTAIATRETVEMYDTKSGASLTIQREGLGEFKKLLDALDSQSLV